jgi:hypothetical protein
MIDVSETATAISDVFLAGGTFALGMLIPSKPNSKTWVALFVTLALSAACGALFHGTIRCHTPAFWVIVTATAVASAFLFLASSLTVAFPSKKEFNWLWPAFTLVGILIGSLISQQPFYFVSIASAPCLALSVFVLTKSPKHKARNWIYIGVALTVAALISQTLFNNVVFHYTQLGANFCFWRGARS